MNEQILKGRWTELKGQAKEKWGRLTNDEIDQVDGNVDQLIGKLQQRYGLVEEEARKEVNAWLEAR
ncbi:CsbD family protein [Hwanghaeella grinnelliae]|uniref:CsbD family protein n=1 Tax=Hwanghaeella grinnelliae TaxID=2500179 RepID=A0A437QWU6_9PROT|nr:CsbD family protein [Hwanghaeella grinnelliae]RVU38997.1 CsbD family protein [Hwanghaeella grinnelliae]